MSTQPQLIERYGKNWSLGYDTTHVPEYLLITLRGQPTVERAHTLLELLDAPGSSVQLSTGTLCPVIVDMCADEPPSVAVLSSLYELADALIPQLSYIVFVLDPARRDGARMRLALRALGLVAAPHIAAVDSMAEALAHIQLYHQRRVTTL